MSHTPNTPPATDNSTKREVKIELLLPIKVGGVEVAELTARRLKLRDRIGIDEQTQLSDAQKEIALFGLMLGLAPDELGQLDLADYQQVQETYLAFLKARPSKHSAPKS